jgi:molecular chaperone DnaJ
VRDPYEVLGVARDASEADLKAAFRRQAALHHPDRNQGDEKAAERFKELNTAYQILSDPQKRAAYDRYGAGAFEPGAGQGSGFSDFGGFDSVFGDILGAFGFRGGDQSELRLQVRLTFEESVFGCERELTYDCIDVCSHCGGSTGEPGTPVDTCRTCAGRGRVRIEQAFFPVAMERPCPSCRGLGRAPQRRCSACAGNGIGKRQRTVQLTIPAGIEDGAARSVPRGGNRIRPDAPAGDLTIVISVAAHERFRRIGDELVCRAPISFVQAALGADMEVATLDGAQTLRIPPGTQSGDVLRLRGFGVPHRVRSGRGDLLVQVLVAVPTKLSPRAEELVRELGSELPSDDEPAESLVDKLRSFFE